jgi:hypothetical protein
MDLAKKVMLPARRPEVLDAEKDEEQQHKL